jgi:hypothetical protein
MLFTEIIAVYTENHTKPINTMNKTQNVRFQVLTAASMKMRAGWDVEPCSLGIDRRFRGPRLWNAELLNVKVK